MAEWNLNFYQGENEYSDGEIEQELLEIVKSTDDYEEVLKNDYRWPILYHLSPLRENIINWYPFDPEGSILEIGAGCGAITGALCRAGKSVTSVELTKIRSEINYERNKKYENWTLITGNFHNIKFSQKFDYIILNGVFEYAASFTHTENPYVDFLSEIKGLIKTDGKILITIENRLGLKYFNGAREDHTGELFSGLNNYQNVDFVKTFSKNKLVKIIEEVGLKHHKFYYPVFDYKFPEIIYSNETFSSMNYNSPQRNLDQSRISFFNEKEVMRSLVDEGIYDRFANSFFIEASKNETETLVVYSKLSTYRKSKFRIMTRIFNDKNEWFVKKEGLNEKSKQHVKEMLKYKNNGIGQFKNIPLTETQNGVSMPYLEGKTFSNELIDLIKAGKRQRFEYEIITFFNALKMDSKEIKEFYSSSFQIVFGTKRYLLPLLCKKRLNIDMIFSNIFKSKEEEVYNVIDYEWTFEFEIPVEYVMWRIIRMFYVNNPLVHKEYTLNSLLSIVGIIENEKLEVFEEWDNYFVHCYVGTIDFSKYEKPVYPYREKLNRALKKSSNIATLYIDYGDGHRPENCIAKEMEVKGDFFKVQYSLDQSIEAIKGVRWDPCETVCKIKQLALSSGYEIIASNSEINLDGWDYYLTSDPMVFIDGDFNNLIELTISGLLCYIDEFENNRAVNEYKSLMDQKIDQLNCELVNLIEEQPITCKAIKLGKGFVKNQLRKREIKYRIDQVEIQDGKKVVMGWAFDKQEEAVNFALIGESAEMVRVKRVLRQDVIDQFGLRNDEKYGFEISFGEGFDAQKVRIKFVAEESSNIVSIDLTGKKYDRNNALINFGSRIVNYRGRHIQKYSEQLKYQHWIEKNEKCREKISFHSNPKISILVPVYNVEKRYLEACVQSVKKQTYTNWELCLVDDCSSKKYIKDYFKELSEDSRIHCRIRETNGHISKASNDALRMATGEFIALLDNDDLLAPFALERMVQVINQNPSADLIYSDEDKITKAGIRCNPFFKPNWSPDTLLSQNYICHFMIVRKTLIDKIGGFEVGLEGAQDYDLALKCTELTTEIYHIPEILYHWRMIASSTAEDPESKRYAFDAGERAIRNALERRGKAAEVSQGAVPGTYIVDYLPVKQAMVSIIIPTKDHAEDLEKCIDSILKTANYPNYEIIVVDNGSIEEKTNKTFKKFYEELGPSFKVLTLDIPFNYSRLNNEAAKIAEGDYLLLLNNDIEIITLGWMSIMLGYAEQDHIGAVGAKLYYPDDTIQHAGVVIGIGGVAGHSHKYYNRQDPGYFSRLLIPADYSAVTAACLMVRKDKYFEVCGLDEKHLSVAFNDVDFCLKLRTKGYYNVCLPKIEAYHYESKSRGVEDNSEKQERFRKEVEYMKKKWKTNIEVDAFYNKNLTLKREDYSIK